MYRTIQQSLLARIQAILQSKYDVTLTNLVVERPPSIALGELALPVAFELAKRLRKAPRAIAAELAAELSTQLPEGVSSVEVAGAGYLNIRLDRAATLRRIAADQHANIGGPGFRLVEHTSINPNKAAHIGHLRNAILGDTFQRLLRPDTYKQGYEVGVQNYIDNTGVQVADVVVGLVHLEGKNLSSTRELLTELLETNQRIDFYCWDLYARVSQWYTADPDHIAARKQIRLDTLHALETGNNETAEIADLIATAVLRRHLETMQRLNIEYDFLPRESEILHLHFWDAARQLMIEKGVLYLETAGKNRTAGSCAAPEPKPQSPTTEPTPTNPTKTPKSSSAPTAPSPTSAKTSPTTSGSSVSPWQRLRLRAILPVPNDPHLLDLHRQGQRPATPSSATPTTSTT